MHVHVGGVGFVHRAGHLLGAQRRHHLARLLAIEALGADVHGAQQFPVRFELVQVLGARNHHRAARREQRVLGEAFGRVFEEGAAGHGEGAHLRRAVALHEERGRTAGGVVARLGFAFEQDHAGMRGEPVGHRGPGDAAADHEVVGHDGSGCACCHRRKV
ncbi:hypothetical protein FQZ97_800950 [compost metagenome]